MDIVRGLTGSDEGIETLASRSDIALPLLCRLLRDPPDVAVPAAEALINLSQNPTLAEKLVSLGAVDAAMEVIYSKWGSDVKLSKLLVMFLVNLTQLDSGVSSLLQVFFQSLLQYAPVIVYLKDWVYVQLSNHFMHASLASSGW